MEARENEWLPYVKMTYYQQLSFMLDLQCSCKKSTSFGKKYSTTLPSLANKYFNSLINENDEIVNITTSI